MILHVFNNQEKFSKGYFKMLHDHGFDLSKHRLFHYGAENDYFSLLGIEAIFSNSWITILPHIKLLQWLYRADKIIVHSLASPMVLLYLLIFPKFRDKVNWVVWGKDLYYYKLLVRPNIAHHIYEFMRKRVFPRIPLIITAFREEYDLGRQWYNFTGENIECALLYPYSVRLDTDDRDVLEKKNGKLILLVGNSSSLTNNHIDALQKLKVFENDIERIICPLSYGGQKSYVKKVCKTGERLFGEKFIAMKDFMSVEDYFGIIGNVDIAIFNHNRQEGLNNIYSLLNQKKTIYMNSTISSWSFFMRNNIQVKNFLDIENESLCKYDDRTLENNRIVLCDLINIGETLKIWKKVLEE